MTLIELAERCEAATGPDREIDAAIVIAADTAPADMELAFGIGWWRGIYDDRHWLAPAYTASLNDAITLLPERWKLRQMAFSAPCADDRRWHLNLHGGREGEDTFVGRGATPALALTAAALRARAASGEGGVDG